MENERYYFVKSTDLINPKLPILVKVSGNKLETFAGDNSPSEFGCSLDRNGSLHVKPGYKSKSVTPNDAELHKSYFGVLSLLAQTGKVRLPGIQKRSSARGLM